jgi:hypothetical protein
MCIYEHVYTSVPAGVFTVLSCLGVHIARTVYCTPLVVVAACR